MAASSSTQILHLNIYYGTKMLHSKDFENLNEMLRQAIFGL
jgi:hypothetical protein